MKNICNIMLVLIMPLVVLAEESEPAPQVDELTAAYQREILFLSTYKKELVEKTKSMQENLGTKVGEARTELNEIESDWLRLQTSNEILMQRLSDIERDYEGRQENRDLLETTLKQASLAGVGSAETKEDVRPMIDEIKSVYQNSMTSLEQSQKITSEQGPYYLKNGEEQTGTIISLGTVARFAESNGKVAALYPSGGGTFRVWEWVKNGQSLVDGKVPDSLQFFLYDNPEKEYAAKQEKTLADTLKAGGLIGWVIIVMGIFAVFISVLRFILLKRAAGQSGSELEEIIEKIKNNDIEEAQHILVRQNNAISRVLGKTISYLKTEPEKVEDAIMESIIKESQLIDRFGFVILVVASVAPLLGLLGTVSGMISTFDIITLYGTGNPKLLSGGISEALVTTMFGLIVAIPALLVGQFLSAKTEGIKSDMEKWALATCNAFNNRKIS